MYRLIERLTGVPARRVRERQERGMTTLLPAMPPHVASIRDHLVRLLNTRRGSAQIDRDYGVPDLAVSPGNNSLADRQALAALIKDVVLRYDTRIAALEVALVPGRDDDVAMRCQLRGALRTELLPSGEDPGFELSAQLMAVGTFEFE